MFYCFFALFCKLWRSHYSHTQDLARGDTIGIVDSDDVLLARLELHRGELDFTVKVHVFGRKRHWATRRLDCKVDFDRIYAIIAHSNRVKTKHDVSLYALIDDEVNCVKTIHCTGVQDWVGTKGNATGIETNVVKDGSDFLRRKRLLEKIDQKRHRVAGWRFWQR